MRTCIDFLLAKKPSTGRILGCGTTSHTTKSASYLLTPPGTLLSPRSYIESITFDVNRTLSRAEIIDTHGRLVESCNDLEATIAEWVAIPEPKPWSGPIMTFSKSRVAELHENIGVVESALAELAEYESRGTAPKHITCLPKEGEIELGPFNLIHDMQDGRLFGQAKRCILGIRGQISKCIPTPPPPPTPTPPLASTPTLTSPSSPTVPALTPSPFSTRPSSPPQTPCEPVNPIFTDAPPPLPPKDKKNSLSSFTSASPYPAYLGAPHKFPLPAPSPAHAPRRVRRKVVPKIEMVPSTSATKAAANPAKSPGTPSGPRSFPSDIDRPPKPAVLVPSPFASTPSSTYLANKPLPVTEPKANHGLLSRLLKPSPSELVPARSAPRPTLTSGTAQGGHRRPPLIPPAVRIARPPTPTDRYYPGWIAGIGAQQVPGP